MCVVSMVMDQGYRDFPWIRPHYAPPYDDNPYSRPWTPPVPPKTPQEIKERNKKLADLLNKQLKQAAEYDKRTNQPHCPDAEKKVKLLKLANELVVRIEFPDEVETDPATGNPAGIDTIS